MNISHRFQTTLAFIRRHGFLLFLGFLSILFVTGLILNSLTPPIPKNQPNEWSGLVPGYAFNAKVVEDQFGKPVNRTVLPGGTQYDYQSSFPLFPHEVITNAEDVVVFITERVPPGAEENFTSYQSSWGDPDLELFLHDEMAYGARVYLEKGVVLIAHQVDGGIREKWYFTPTSEEVFRRSWGAQLEDELEPHAHPPFEQPLPLSE